MKNTNYYIKPTKRNNNRNINNNGNQWDGAGKQIFGFFLRSAGISVAIYLILHFLTGCQAANVDYKLNTTSKVGTANFQEYDSSNLSFNDEIELENIKVKVK